MKRPVSKSMLAVGAMIVLGAIVLVLAVLQYRWTGQISQAEQERIKATLATGVSQFGQEFSDALLRLGSSLLVDPAAPASELEKSIAEQFFTWESAGTHPKLVAGLYLWMTDSSRPQGVLKLDLKTGRFEAVTWPARLEPLRLQMERQDEELLSLSEREAYRFPWLFYAETPAIGRPIFQFSQGYSARATEAQHVGFLVAELSLPFLQQEYLPELAGRYFGSGQAADFDVSVQTARAPYQVIYPPGAQARNPASPADAAANLLDPASGPPPRGRGPGVLPSDEDRQWQVVVRHSSGTLEEAVAALRWRNLAISFVLLFALAACTALILELARRAHRLAELQMEFVAGISHELCTPLAVICAAADNLADGVMDNPQQTREYGGMIRDEGRRLARKVDEVLLFAAGEAGRFKYGLRPIEVGPVIDCALAVAGSMFSEAGFVVEKEIAADIPPVMGDVGALGQCLENLLSNAFKYGKPNRWVAVRARTVPELQPKEVEISVEDKGPGIPAGDLSKVFDPFYRVQAARDDQIRGVGLGLHLVKRMVEGMGGRVSVSSRPGSGSVFTLHFAAAPLEKPIQRTV